MLLTSVTPPFQFGCSGPLRPHFSLRSSVVNTGSPACFLIGIPYFFSRLDINVLLQPNFSAIARVLNFLSTYKTRRTSSVIFSYFGLCRLSIPCSLNLPKITPLLTPNSSPMFLALRPFWYSSTIYLTSNRSEERRV